MHRLNKHTGFTLVEILIALFIFAILSVLLATALRHVISMANGLTAHAEQLHDLEMTLLLISRDIEQTVPRPIIGNNGKEEGAFVGEERVFSLTHTGLANGDQAQRSSMQRVTYYWKNNAIIRATWPVLDLAPETKPQTRTLLNDVIAAHFAFLDHDGKLQRAWPNKGEATTSLPLAVQLTLTLKNKGTIKQLYVIPAQN